MGQGNKPVVVFGHEMTVIFFGFPHITRRKLMGLVGTKQHVGTQKTGVALGFSFPNFTVGLIDRDVLFLNAKQN